MKLNLQKNHNRMLREQKHLRNQRRVLMRVLGNLKLSCTSPHQFYNNDMFESFILLTLLGSFFQQR